MQGATENQNAQWGGRNSGHCQVLCSCDNRQVSKQKCLRITTHIIINYLPPAAVKNIFCLWDIDVSWQKIPLLPSLLPLHHHRHLPMSHVQVLLIHQGPASELPLLCKLGIPVKNKLIIASSNIPQISACALRCTSLSSYISRQLIPPHLVQLICAQDLCLTHLCISPQHLAYCLAHNSHSINISLNSTWFL